MPRKEIPITGRYQGNRLDVFISQMFPQDFSRSQVQKLIKDGAVRVDGREVTSHYRVKEGEKVEIDWRAPADNETRAEEIPIDILFEDEDLIVVNKTAGMVVHPAHGNLRHTLVNALLHHTRDLSGVGGPIRPGIVHRLDKDTSGILVVAKNNKAHANLANQFKKHTIQRTYQVVVRGVVQHDEGMIQEPVGRSFLSRKKVVIKPAGGKDATTFYRVLKRFRHATLLEVHPKTGRTHQIRVHLAHLGHPVLGDTLYGVNSDQISRQALHAAGLAFRHPRTHEQVAYQSPLPEDISRLVTYLESQQ